MKLDIYTLKGKKTGEEIDLPADIFEAPVNKDLMHQAYVRQMANARLGTHSTRGRSEVRGGGRKPFKQKGTGRARQGSIRAAQWVGGGKVHTPKPRDYTKDMPKKMRQLANKNALLAKLVDGEVKCIVDLDFADPKTKEFKAILDAVGVDRSCLVAVDSENRNAAVSARNIANVDTIRIDQLNVFELLNHRYLVVDKASMEAFLDGSVWKKVEEVA